MRSFNRLLGVVLLMGCASFIHAQDREAEAAVLRDAQQIAYCATALDAACVIQLSDAPSYQLLSSPQPSPHFDFAAAQSRFYAALRSRGAQYTRFEVSAATAVFAGNDRLYAFVPYRSTLEIPGREAHEYEGFFVAISRDEGSSWKFVDVGSLPTDQLQKIIPGYDGQPPPPVKVGSKIDSRID